ncbi:MAG: hypothetical protein ABGZ17_00270 [Planctomycetaceae bacterium]
MRELIDALVEHAADHWIKVATGLVLMAAGWCFGRYREKTAWKKRKFLDRLNVTLNSIRGGKFRIRTILEKRCEDVFLNSVASATITAAAEKTTADDAIIPLPERDYWYYLNDVLNEISEKFALGQLQADIGKPVKATTYVMTLTCESDGPLRTRKIRAMLIRKELLANLPEKMPALESKYHITRWNVLRQLAQTYQTTPHRFLEMELCL